jgi:hypothetical protein
MGACASGNGMHHLMQRHACGNFNPNKEPTA